MRAITPRRCAAAAPPIRREIVDIAVAGVFVRLPFVLPPRRRLHPRLLSAATNSLIMGSLDKREEGEGEEEEKRKAPAKEESQSLPPPPPQKQKQKQKQQPPEKPLPGDCCGSGCVRCVWDVYYEELDAYQKSLSSTSNTEDN